MTLIINTLVYEDEIDRGKKQIELVDRIANLGADGIEIRREYFKDPKKEIVELADKIRADNLLCNYSVPDTVFDAQGKFNAALANYYKEAEELGAQKIKFNIGNYYAYNGDLAKNFENIPLSRFQTTIENDQTPIGGSPDTVYDFLTDCRNSGLNSIGVTFDMGNLAWAGFDPIWAAKKLAPYVAYIHLKNPMLNSKGIYANTQSLDKGMLNWKTLLAYLPQDVECAFEFAMSNDETIRGEIKKFHDYFHNER